MNNTQRAAVSQGLLTFQLTNRQTFAIGTLKVQEVLSLPKLTQVPGSPNHVIGTSYIRNRKVPIIDTAAAIGFRPLSKEQYPDCQLIITDCLKMVVGFLVNRVDRIIDCDWSKIDPPPHTLGSNTFVTGVTRHEQSLVQLLDVERLLDRISPNLQHSEVSAISQQEQQVLQKLNLLLVDDSSIARRQLCDALDKLNVEYTMCTNGKEALAAMNHAANADRAIDILVSDIEMPEMDGYELVFSVQNDPKLNKAYRILHTSLSSEISVERAQQVGAHQALEKFNANELISAIITGAQHLAKGAAV